MARAARVSNPNRQIRGLVPSVHPVRVLSALLRSVAELKRLQAAGKSKREALRVLKRRLVRVILNLLHADLDQTGRGQSATPLPAQNPAA